MCICKLRGAWTATTENFLNKFKADPIRASHGRAHRGLPPGQAQLVKSIEEVLKIILKQFGLKDTDFVQPDTFKNKIKLHQLVQPCVYATVSGQTKPYSEQGLLPTLRANLVGSKQVIMVSCLSVRDHLVATSEDGHVPVPKNILDWLGSLNETTLKAFVDAEKAKRTESGESSSPRLMFGTIGVRDAMYTPPGWFVLERTTGASDIGGIKIAWLASVHAPAFEQYLRYFQSVSVHNENLEAAGNVLALAA